MAVGRSPIRSIASLGVALILVATASAGAVAAPRGSVGARTSGTAPTVASKKLPAGLTFTSRTAGTRPSVNMRTLAAKKPIKREHRTLPFLGRAASGGETKPSGGGPKAVLAVPAPPTEGRQGGADALRTEFDGLAQASSSETSGEPPDPWVAVGPEHIVQAVNLSLRVTDRQGGLP